MGRAVREAREREREREREKKRERERERERERQRERDPREPSETERRWLKEPWFQHASTRGWQPDRLELAVQGGAKELPGVL